MNAMLAVVLPDEAGSYQYFIENVNCPSCQTVTWKTEQLFGILKDNMFNRKQQRTTKCANGCGREPHIGSDHSYIHPVRWEDFVGNEDGYIKLATALKENAGDFNVSKVM
jgi:hypothetical protein